MSLALEQYAGNETGLSLVTEEELALNGLTEVVSLRDVDDLSPFELAELENMAAVAEADGQESLELVRAAMDEGDLRDTWKFIMDRAAKERLLKPWEVVELSKRKDQGDQAAKEQLIAANLRLVASFALQRVREGSSARVGDSMELSDVFQDGVVGLIRGVEKFDHKRGFMFSTYATWWIRQAITRGIDDKDRMIRIPVHVVERQRALESIEVPFITTKGRAPSVEELESETTFSVKEITETKQAFEIRRVASLNTFVDDQKEMELGEVAKEVAVDENHPDLVHELNLSSTLRQAINELPDDEKTVLISYFGLGGTQNKSMEAIGGKMGLDSKTVRRLKDKAIRRLQDAEKLRLATGYDQSDVDRARQKVKLPQKTPIAYRGKIIELTPKQLSVLKALKADPQATYTKLGQHTGLTLTQAKGIGDSLCNRLAVANKAAVVGALAEIDFEPDV